MMDANNDIHHKDTKSTKKTVFRQLIIFVSFVPSWWDFKVLIWD